MGLCCSDDQDRANPSGKAVIPKHLLENKEFEGLSDDDRNIKLHILNQIENYHLKPPCW